MLRILTDQNLNNNVLRGLKRRIPRLDAMTAFEIGMSDATDPELLDWASLSGRIIITRDGKTMPTHAAAFLAEGKRIAGLFVVPHHLPLNRVIEDLEVMINCSENDEWVDVIRYLPL